MYTYTYRLSHIPCPFGYDYWTLWTRIHRIQLHRNTHTHTYAKATHSWHSKIKKQHSYDQRFVILRTYITIFSKIECYFWIYYLIFRIFQHISFPKYIFLPHSETLNLAFQTYACFYECVMNNVYRCKIIYMICKIIWYDCHSFSSWICVSFEKLIFVKK